MKTQNQMMRMLNKIIRNYHNLFTKKQVEIRRYLVYLRNRLELKTKKTIQKYSEFIAGKGELLPSNNETIYLPVVIIAVVGLYVLDQIILSDLYDYMAQFNDKDIPDIYRKIIKFTLPLIILVLYAYLIEGYSKSKEE